MLNLDAGAVPVMIVVGICLAIMGWVGYRLISKK